MHNSLFNALVAPRYYDNHKWPLALALAIAGVLCWVLGARMEPQRREPSAAAMHTFLFVPMRWWGPVLWALSVACVALEFTNPAA